ncbi:MAG: hypothetical protein M3R30_02860 [Candidatus Eremiobacteraeota bacterium]|nr:hypothetical protein [Candidatus Eremiobacteraeota bacterium]
MMLLAFLIGSGAAGAAVPKHVPGGANQVTGVSGTLSQTLFNGTFRLRAMSLGDALPTDNEHPNKPDERALVFRGIVSNGSHHERHGYFNATLSDADGITVEGRPLDDGWDIAQGAAARFAIGFSVPAGFVPVKLVLVEAATQHEKAFRITLKGTHS